MALFEKNKFLIMGPKPPPYGGVSIYVRQLYSFLKSERYCVKTKSIDFGKPRILNIAKVLRAYFSIITNEAVIIDNYDFAWKHPFLVLPFLASRKFLKKKYFLFVHDGNFPEIIKQYSNIKMFFLKILLKHVDAVMCNGTEIKGALFQRTHCKNKISILPPLIEYPHGSKKPLPEPINDFIDSHKPLFVSIGAMIEDYGFLKILQAFKKYITPKQKNAGIIFISGGFAIDKEYQERLKKIIRSGLDRNVFILNDTEPEVVFSIMPRTNVFVRATKTEGFGMSAYESVFLGNIPVVSNVKKWPSSFISFKYGDVDDLGKKMIYALELAKDNEVLMRNMRHAEKVIDKNREDTNKFFSELGARI